MNLINDTSWQEQTYQWLVQGDYLKAAQLYEETITLEPEVKSHYWHLGLLFLLQEQEAEAHATWLLGMMEGGSQEIEQQTEELIEVLETEAQRRESLDDKPVAWLIREHIREVQPTNINNLLHLILRSIETERFTGDDLADWGAIELLQGKQGIDVDSTLLLQAIENVLEAAPLHPSSLELVEACLAYFPDEPESLILLRILLEAAIRISASLREPEIAAMLCELCLRLDIEKIEVLGHLAGFYQSAGQFDRGIKAAKQSYSLCTELSDRVFANHLLLKGLTQAGGHWEEAVLAFQQQEELLESLIETEAPQKPIDRVKGSRLFGVYFFAPYFRDDAIKNRKFQNQLSSIGQENLEFYAKDKIRLYSHKHALGRQQASKEKNREGKKLKIGYLSSCLRRNSVGWLARWIFNYHDRDRFKIYGYFVKPQDNDNIQEWYVSQVDKAYKSNNTIEIAEQIYQDEIDILIDLDSITLDFSCEIVSLKPAPVQVTWLGWDASGIPAIDYYIADSYVLPEDAQEYYREKIWRLPQTYIAVDGFEVGVPTLRRDRLGIPSDAVIYFSSQVGYKRHRDTARLQMKIIKEVPNSYFLIKGFGDQESLKNFFLELAEEEGVDGERLRFLSGVPAEAVHRANLGIADVVLDTYPYNGATTTLETLWMGIPLVTQVGEQFSARNSYAMMMNVGVTEGIARTSDEYVEWGVRLGKDAKLRQKISWQLHQSRQTSPLWNGKQFTRDMENAYEEMWQRYLEGV